MFGALTDGDFYEMFKNKVGVARQIMIFRDEWLSIWSNPQKGVECSNTETDNYGSESSDTFPASSSSSSDANLYEYSSPALALPADLNKCKTKSMWLGGNILLPKFSAPVAAALDSGKIVPVIHLFVEECANHILANGDMRSKSEYGSFCKKLCETYPCLAFSGRHEWTYISKKLSQKIRTIRLCQKRMKDPSMSNVPARRSCSFEDGSTMTLEEARQRLELELSKQDGHWPTVQSLFKYLHHERRAALAKMTSHSVANILETFPTLGQMKLVREEFKLLVVGDMQVMRVKYLKIMEKLEVIFKAELKDSGLVGGKSDVEKLLLLQTALSDRRIKSGSRRQAFEVYDAHSIDISSKRSDPPVLLLARHQSGEYQGWVVADGKTISNSFAGAEIFDLLIGLISCYYAWDLAYPKDFQILGFLQEHVVGDRSNKFFKSSKFLLFEKQFED